MRLAVLVEPQLGATYANQLRIAQHAEALGFEAFFRAQAVYPGLPTPRPSW